MKTNKIGSKNYEFEELVQVVKRENNLKRSFLFLNKLQAKYVPSVPDKTIELFQTLGEKVLTVCGKDKKAVVIGFAETATAIGAVVADCLETETFYIHTTREKLDPKHLIASFEEEHSHATSHYLHCDQVDVLKNCQVLVFVDDEFTTGKTICNFVKALKKENWIADDCQLMAVSLINCMKPTDIDVFDKYGIGYEYLIKEDRNWHDMSWGDIVIPDTKNNTLEAAWSSIHVKGKMDTRTGAYINEYKEGCKNLAINIDRKIDLRVSDERILVLGTEECMYPAILYGNWLQDKHPDKYIRTHATSRSPILPLDDSEYIIKNRSQITSLYDKDRLVFLYNLDRYDKVIVITDTKDVSLQAMNQLVAAIQQYGSTDIIIVQWEEK